MENEIGEITNYFEHVGAAAIKLSKKLKLGEKIRVKGGETEFDQVVKSMQIDREDVKEGKVGDEIGILVSQKVRKGYKVYKLK